MGQKKRSNPFEPFELNMTKLRQIFDEAVKNGKCLWPDEAMQELFRFWGNAIEKKIVGTPEKPIQYRIDNVSLSRKIHHLAVDLFYDIYLGKREGAPEINDEYYSYILSLHEQGLSYGKIAKKVGLPTKPPNELTRSRDRVRKQLDAAKKKFR